MQDFSKTQPLANNFGLKEPLFDKPKTASQKSSREIIDRLVNLLLIEQVYFNTFEYKQTVFNELIILLPNTKSQHITEARPLIRTIMSDYPEYGYRVFYIAEVKRDIKNGNIIFFSICCSEKLVYSCPESTVSLLSQDIPTKAVLRKGKRAFKCELRKINSFKAGMQFYFEKKDYRLTAFMLHQVIETCYRAGELFAIGRAKTTHSIRNHIIHIHPYIQELGELFNKDDEEEMQLLNLLDDAYLAVRYENNYHIKKEQLTLLINKALMAENLVRESCEAILRQIEENYKSPLSIENENNSSDKGMELYIEQITAILPVERIYCFGTSTYTSDVENSLLNKAEQRVYIHYNLLIILTDPVDDRYAKIEEMTDLTSTAYITFTPIIHSKYSIYNKKNSNNYFFQLVMKQSKQVYVQPGTAIDFDFIVSDKLWNHQTLESHWNHRIKKAKILLNTAAVMEKGCEDLVLALQNTGLRQLCLGLIYVHLRYTPNNRSLSHLVELCSLLTDQTKEYFPRHTQEERKLLTTLNEAWKYLTNQATGKIHQADIDLLMQRSKGWLKETERMVAEKLN